MPPFIPGLELCRRFYTDAVAPILAAAFPGLRYAAARIGAGSEVLGFDTPMSMDHDWGPSVLLFLSDSDAANGLAITALLRQQLPRHFLGFDVAFPDDPHDTDPRHHAVWGTTCRQFFREQLSFDIEQPLSAADWLSIPAQLLRVMTDGAVYRDDTGELSAVRARLAYYPHDIWLYLLASGWQRISQEEHLMPRAGYVGDELGSAIIGSRLVRDIMHLCFLMERRYAPYPKWFGTAFRQLACAAEFEPILWNAQRAATWQEREAALCTAYEYLARMHNRLGLTEALSEQTTSFFDRPFRVIGGERFAQALCARIADPEIRRLSQRRLIGSIDQWSDSTDIRSEIAWRPLLRTLYTE